MHCCPLRNPGELPERLKGLKLFANAARSYELAAANDRRAGLTRIGDWRPPGADRRLRGNNGTVAERRVRPSARGLCNVARGDNGCDGVAVMQIP